MAGRDPPLHLLRRLSVVPPTEQGTTSVTVGELLLGAARRGSPELTRRVRDLIESAGAVLPFDAAAAETYGSLRAELEASGQRLAEPDLRIASIALARDAVLVMGNEWHFLRVSGLAVENWLAPA